MAHVSARENSLTIRHAQQCYIFDYVFGPEATQQQVFEESCLPLIDDFFAGQSVLQKLRTFFFLRNLSSTFYPFDISLLDFRY